MTKEELEKEASEYALEWGEKTDGTYACCREGYLAGAEPREKRIEELEHENTELKEVHENDKRSLRLIAEKGADLEKKISILLSCNNCPDNKGGYICQKEYEDKCLAQKIQYIKELKEENAELKRNEFNARSCLELQQSQDKAILNYMGEQLTKAKEFINEFMRISQASDEDFEHDYSDLIGEAEQFLKEGE